MIQHQIQLAQLLYSKLFDLSQDFWVYQHPEANADVLITAAGLNLLTWVMANACSHVEAQSILEKQIALMKLWIETAPNYLFDGRN